VSRKFLSAAILAFLLGASVSARAAEPGYIGLDISPLTTTDMQRLGLSVMRGVLIRGVRPDGPGVKAGLSKDDIIMSFDGAEVSGFTQLVGLAGAKKAGDPVKLSVFRQGKIKVIDMVATPRPKDAGKPAVLVNLKGHGLEVVPATEEIRANLKIETKLPGLAITLVDKGKAADKAGLKVGDVIFMINRSPVQTTHDFDDAWDAALKAGRDSMAVHFYRGLGRTILPLPVKP